MSKLKVVLNWATALFGLVAAVLWLQSTRVRFAEAQIIVDGADFFASAYLQARWNGWAAAMGISVGCQAIAMMLPN